MTDTPRPLDADDIAAALTAFAVGMTAASRHADPEDRLQALSAEIGDFAALMPGTGAQTILERMAAMLRASQPSSKP